MPISSPDWGASVVQAIKKPARGGAVITLVSKAIGCSRIIEGDYDHRQTIPKTEWGESYSGHVHRRAEQHLNRNCLPGLLRVARQSVRSVELER